MEAAGGFEPPNNGFADRRLTTWLCRPITQIKKGPIRPTIPVVLIYLVLVLKVNNILSRCLKWVISGG